MNGREAFSPTKKGYGYRDLLVWQKGIELAKKVYGLTARFPARKNSGWCRRCDVRRSSTVNRGDVECAGF
jgi:hypothetical protein